MNHNSAGTRLIQAIFIVASAAALDLAAGAQDSPPPLPPPGRLVDVGGWRLHLNCTGKASPGQPTVVLEAGAGDFSVEWSLVQPRVAAFARVCSYDRAGDGWSEMGPYPRTMHQVAYELRTLLDRAGEHAPFVLVGHSYGGWLVRVYRAMYSSDVAALVLVEGGADNPWRMTGGEKIVRSAELPSSKPIPPVKTSDPLVISAIPPSALAQMRQGLDDEVRRANDPPRDKLPPDAQRMRTWALGQLGHVASGSNPFTEEELAQLRAEHPSGEAAYGDLPLIVITRGRPDETGGSDGPAFQQDRIKDNAALAGLSRNGQHVIAERSAHHVQLEQPELVIKAIQQVIASAARK